MKVTATARGFTNAIKEAGDHFEIPDKPTRKLTEKDDALTKAIADKKGLVPAAFASSWMRPGWDWSGVTQIPEVPETSRLTVADDGEVNLNESVI